MMQVLNFITLLICWYNVNACTSNPCTKKEMLVNSSSNFIKYVKLCEDAVFSIGCKKNEKIIVFYAIYSGYTSDTCSCSSKTNCDNQNKLNIVRNSCSTKSSCNISATNVVLGDTCVGIVKTFEVYYYCYVPESTLSLQNYVPESTLPLPKIINIQNITNYSVNVTLDLSMANCNGYNLFVIICYNKMESKVFNISYNYVVIQPLNSFTFYNISVGVKNELGAYFYGKEIAFQTNEDVPTGYPSNFSVKKVNFTTLLLSWGEVEYLMRNGIIKEYRYFCNNTEKSVLKTVNNSTLNVTVSGLDPDKIYSCYVAACTKVGCGIQAQKLNNTLDGTAWLEWESWTSCNDSYGFINRSRECSVDYNTRWCSGNITEFKKCSEKWTVWSECSASCEMGSRKRYSLHKTQRLAQTETCNINSCPVDGMWGDWNRSMCMEWIWYEYGIKTYNRKCNSPTPSFYGRDCIGVSNYTEVFNSDIIFPVNGNWSFWSSWTLCNQPCGRGKKSRFRSCSNPTPNFGGQYCNGSSEEPQECNPHDCKKADLKLSFMTEKYTDARALKDLINSVITRFYSKYKIKPPSIVVQLN